MRSQRTAKTFSFHHSHWFIVAIIGLAFLARLYRFDNPIADWHSWRQADTASVTREYAKGQAEWLVPEYHDLSNIPSGEHNPEGYRMVEFPLYNWLSLAVYTLAPVLGIVGASRLIAILFSLGTIYGLYRIVKGVGGSELTALLAAAIVAFLPYSVFYSRVILPEPVMLSLSVISVWGLVEWLGHKKNSAVSLGWFGLSWISLTLALLVKPTAIFIAPVFVLLALHRFGWKAVLQPLLWSYILTIAPMAAWRDWIQNYPAGIPASSWLLNGNGIRLRPAWFRWLFYERLTKLFLGYIGVLVGVLGGIDVLRSLYKHGLKLSQFDVLTISWGVSVLSYLIIFATGNVQHDYYQVPLIPVVALMVARGLTWIITITEKNRPKLGFGIAGLLLAATLYLSWQQVRGYFNVNNPALMVAGAAVDAKTPPDALVIAPYQGDTAFLYQTNRRGWPLGWEIDKKIEAGATHYVTTALDNEAKELEARYTTIEKTDLYLLLDLTKPLATASATPSATID